MARPRRVWVPGASAGRVAELPEEEAHHVRDVLRLRHGEALTVFDGRGGEWHARLEAVGTAGARVAVEGAIETPVEAPVELTLFQGLCRPERIEWVVQKATEVGAARIVLLATARTEGKGRPERRLERWRRIALEATKQSGRRRIPELALVDGGLPAAEPGVVAFALHPEGGSTGLGGALEPPAPRRVWLAVGPEGGFAPEEVAQAADRGWTPVRLGPRILRTETAGIVAAAIVLHRWADLG